MLISFVGAASSPLGKWISLRGINAPDQLETKMNKKTVLTYGTQGL